jgi:drug/metabolite transporter (DMT)-like permease
MDGQHRTSPIPVLAVALAVAAWGFGSILVKLVSFDGVLVSFYRLWLGFAVMFVFLYVTNARLTLASLREALPAGLLFGVNVAMYFSAVKLTSVANATLISALQPGIVLLVAGPWFHERVGLRNVVWTLVSFAGIGVVVAGASGAPQWSPFGDLLAFGALLTFTGYFLLSKRLSASVSPTEYVTAIQLIAAIVVTPMIFFSPDPIGFGVPVDWLWMVGIVLVGGLGGHLLVNWAHRYVDVSVSSLMLLGTPIVASLGAWAVLAEALSPLQLLGGAMTLVGIAMIAGRAGSAIPPVVHEVPVGGEAPPGDAFERSR